MEYNIPDLVKKALEAKQYAYVPYSGFAVGAALLCMDGEVVMGCNIENAAYSPTNCAERTAVFKAVSEGRRGFLAIAVAGDNNKYLAPCGVCRQVLLEFCSPDEFDVIFVKSETEYKVVKLGSLLPFAFSSADLQ